MNKDLIILLIAVPFAAGIVTLFLTGRRLQQRVVGYTAMLAQLALAAWGAYTVLIEQPGRVLVSQMGQWPAPFGITVALDGLSALMVLGASVVCGAVFLYCTTQLPASMRSGFFHPLFHMLGVGVYWSFLTGDLFNLFVAFEIMLMSSYALLVIGTSALQMRQAYKYILLNLLASMMFVTCCGLIYGFAGTLNMADLARMSIAGLLPPGVVPVMALLLVVFSVKAAVFPVWFWLPDTYPTINAAIGGLFGGLLTKVGAYVLIRIFVMTLGQPGGPVTQTLVPLLIWAAVITMFVGVLGAVSRHSVRTILSVHIISQVGYMVMGIALALSVSQPEVRQLAVAGAIFFVLHNMVVKSALFLCGGLMHTHAGTDDLNYIGGLLARSPILATMFFIAALSLAGLPPLSGFFGKLLLVRAAFESSHWLLGVVAMLTSVFTLLSMLKIWSNGFWCPAQGAHAAFPDRRPHTAGGLAAIAVLVITALSMGLGANLYYGVADTAAAAVINPTGYIDAVLYPDRIPGPMAGADLTHTHPLAAHAPGMVVNDAHLTTPRESADGPAGLTSSSPHGLSPHGLTPHGLSSQGPTREVATP